MDDLTTFSARHLVTLLHQGEVSAVEVLEAHLERIQSVNPWIHALVVERFDSARREAERADHRRAGGEPLGPLHGLPVSIKEMFDVAELPTTAGIQRRQARAVSRDAELVRRWRAAGAIVLGKTNVPQLGILAESDNPVYGRTNNPWDWNRTPGGSSGGEAALIAAGGSPLGLGSDGGGSIRLPAHFCGICGFKPTGGRLPLLGHWLSTNWPADWAQPGPMARCVDDLVLGLQACAVPAGESAIAGEHPQRICAEPLTTLAGCRIGFYEELPFLPAAPAVRRAVRVAADALSGLGAELVPFRIDRLEEAWGIFRKLFYAEGLRDFRRQLRGSAVDPRVQRYLQFCADPPLVAARARHRLGLAGTDEAGRIAPRLGPSRSHVGPVLSASDGDVGVSNPFLTKSESAESDGNSRPDLADPCLPARRFSCELRVCLHRDLQPAWPAGGGPAHHLGGGRRGGDGHPTAR